MSMLSISSEARSKRLAKIDPSDFSWSIPIMRTGYAGRGLVYLTVAAFSLWSISNGGSAEGAQETMDRLRGGWGTIVVGLIALGMFAYAVWRVVDSIWDLEAYGRDVKGIIARGGMIVTGLVHLGIGLLAISALGGIRSASDSEGSGGMQSKLGDFLSSNTGQIAVGIAGALTIAAGAYYLHKAWTENYRSHLKGNPATMHLNLALKAGVAAQGVVVGIIGFLILRAAWTASSSEAGGMGSAFDWLYSQAYGHVLVIGLCLGLLGFSLFCFVNAAYRIIPKASDPSTESLFDKLRTD